MRALVVDDSSPIRKVLRSILTQFGFDVVEAANAQQALERLDSQIPMDLALFDLNMPEVSGFELLRIVRSDQRWEKMKVMMVTTETDMGTVEKALDIGANEFVMKPFNNDIIEHKLEILGLRDERS